MITQLLLEENGVNEEKEEVRRLSNGSLLKLSIVVLGILCNSTILSWKDRLETSIIIYTKNGSDNLTPRVLKHRHVAMTVITEVYHRVESQSMWNRINVSPLRHRAQNIKPFRSVSLELDSNRTKIFFFFPAIHTRKLQIIRVSLEPWTFCIFVSLFTITQGCLLFISPNCGVRVLRWAGNYKETTQLTLNDSGLGEVKERKKTYDCK